MRTWTATTTAEAAPDAVLGVLVDPAAMRDWAPVDFDVEHLDGARLAAGARARVSGRLAGRRVAFDVAVHEADAGAGRLRLSAAGPVAFDVAYDLAEVAGGSEVRASVSVRPGPGLTGRVVASATAALLSAGALDSAVARIARAAAV